MVDLGCGSGTWLKAFKNVAATKLVGYDGNLNNQRTMIDQSIVFRSATHFAEVLANAGHHPIKNLAFMDCVHPTLYQSGTGTKAAIEELSAKAIPKPLLSLAQRIKSRLT